MKEEGARRGGKGKGERQRSDGKDSGRETRVAGLKEDEYKKVKNETNKRVNRRTRMFVPQMDPRAELRPKRKPSP